MTIKRVYALVNNVYSPYGEGASYGFLSPDDLSDGRELRCHLDETDFDEMVQDIVRLIREAGGTINEDYRTRRRSDAG